MARPRSMTTMLSASRSASSRYCVVSKTVVPPTTSERTDSHTSLRPRGSRPVVGSSRNSTFGMRMKLAARSNRRLMPPGEDLVHRGLLSRQPDLEADLAGLAHHVGPGDLGPAAIGPEQGGQYPHRRGLSRPVRSEQPAHRTLRHGQVEPVKGSGLAVPLA